ncbi:MAG: NYN domain-containing protein [Novipirellula sp. JB048]
MSLLLIVDGYNVIAPVAAPGRASKPSITPPTASHSRWLGAERNRLISRLCDHLPETVRKRTCVVFDARCPPQNAVHQYQVSGIDIRFAVDEPEADDLIERLISEHSAPKQLAVVSSDHRLQEAAKRRGATPFDSEPWLDDLLEDQPHLAIQVPSGAGQGSTLNHHGKPNGNVSSEEVEHWMREFGFEE